MYQASLPHRRSSSPSSRVWSHNTGYTGAAGIHSEVGSGTYARNQRMLKQASNIMTAEEDLMKKEMKAMKASRKSMESSMLSYSQKMRDIADKKTQPRKSPLPSRNSKHPRSFEKCQGKIPANGNLSPLEGSIPNKTDLNETLESSRSNYSFASDNLSHMSNRKQDSRLSVDSGIGLESHRESLKIPHESFISEEENVNLNHSLDEKLNSSNEISISDVPKDGFNQRGRLRQRKRFCDSKTSKFAPIPIVDKKEKEVDDEKEETEAGYDDDIITPRIAPFPDNLFNGDFSISPWVLDSIMEGEDLLDPNENCVVDSMHGKKNRRNGLNLSKSKSRTPYVLFRPKPAQSPSLAALRHRFFRRFGARSIYFRYSEEVLAALRSLSNSPERRKSGKSNQSLSPSSRSGQSLSPSKRSLYPFTPPSSPKLHGLDMEELFTAHSSRSNGLATLFMDEDEMNEFFLTKDLPKLPQLSRERSFSAPSSKATQRSFVSKLDKVKENDTKLKPVLKKDDIPFSTEKKNVQFFLPDIFKRANMCTSQGSEYS